MYSPQYTNPQKPKVGLAVICRCCLGNSYVQCLLQKRGPHSSSPYKWSFPGGRLGHPGDLEDDGAVGTKRELEEECGGGTPPGLPPLIHIECCKSGKVKQTLYHVYVVDTSTEKEWEHWQPKPKEGRPTEVDMSASDLIIRGQSFPCVNGYCWVDMSILIEECYEVTISSEDSDLQHGLVRWVNNYGEHVLKTLIARSPKIPHARRLSNPLPTNGFGGTTVGSRPRGPRLDTSPNKPRRYAGTNVRATLLQPPYMPGQIVRPMFQGSPTSAFYRINPMPPPLAFSADQLSPTGGVGGALGSPLAINNIVGGMDNVPNIVVPIPRQQGPRGIMVYQPTTGQFQSSTENLQHQQSTPGLLTSTESLNVNSSNVQFPLSSSPGHRIGEVTDSASPAISHVPTPLQVQSSKLVSEVSPTAVIVPSGQSLPQAVFQANHQIGMEAHQMSVLGPGHIPSAVSLANQEHALLPSTSAQIPVHYGENPSGVSNAPPAPTRTADTGPLLPNPPQPIIPQFPHPVRMGVNLPGHYSKQQQQPYTSGPAQQNPNLRKDTLCKHYIAGQGQCPYGEKCWFAHSDPTSSLQSPQRWASKVATSVYSPTMSSQASPLHTPVPGHNLWMTNQNVVVAGMPQFVMASPPQSPLNTGVVTVPSAHLGSVPTLNQPRATYPLMANQQQWPLLFVRPPPPQRNDNQLQGQGSAFATMTNSATAASGVSVPQNPVLRFDLLTDLKIRENDYTVSNITQLASRADHFYVSYNSQVLDYKIMFGSNRPSSDRCYLTEKRSLYDNVSCLHCSRQQQALLVIGTEMGNISMWDLRRGMAHGNVTEVCKTMSIPHIPVKPSEAITSLIHFSTSIQLAQVVVAGTRGGTLSWYISQPPQKTFSLLYSNGMLHSQQNISALQVLGGYLVSGDRLGRVILWSMQSQCPVVDSSIVAHNSLHGLHVIDNNHFLTIGTGPVASTHIEESSFGGGLGATSAPSGGHVVAGVSGNQSLMPIDNLTSDMSCMSVGNFTSSVTTAVSNTGTPRSHDQNRYSVCLWQFNKPPKLLTSISEEGVVISTSFHCHNPPGNMFLAVGLQGGTVKIYNIPSFTVASELHFPEMKGMECVHVNLNHSREIPITNQAYFRNPFRDLILTTVWSDGRIMICQVARQ